MTRNEQKICVMSLVDNIQTDLLVKIHNGKIPAEWGGREFRLYLAEKFQDACWGKLSKQEKKDFRNALLINNL